MEIKKNNPYENQIEIHFGDLNKEAQEKLKPYLRANINIDAPIAIIDLSFK